ncbi:MAG TPA: hypothetical protein VD969_05955 [Symbiobacteriaceae bacterium]|nr:hypothetical protein [Symbiobacteriaceae bacterium]
MSDDQRPSRRFRITRKVKKPDPEPYAQQVMREVETEDVRRSTPEMDRAVSKGCMGCLRVSLLFVIIMLASIIATWCIRRQGV